MPSNMAPSSAISLSPPIGSVRSRCLGARERICVPARRRQGGWEAVVQPAWDGSKTALAGSKSGCGRR
jgi:hypothetical protein